MDAADQMLLARIACGDREAFADFYDKHAGRVYGMLLKLLRSDREAEDVLQETFWHVWTRAEQFDARRGTPLAWLILVGRSRALDHLRRKTRRRPTDSEPAEAMDLTDISGDVEQREDAQRAAAALSILPEDQRVAIQLAFYEGLSHQQIAERQNIALGTIKTRIRLGMKKLRELLVSEPLVA